MAKKKTFVTLLFLIIIYSISSTYVECNLCTDGVKHGKHSHWSSGLWSWSFAMQTTGSAIIPHHQALSSWW